MWSNLKQNREDIFLKRIVAVFILFVFVFVVFVFRVIQLTLFERNTILSELAPQVVPTYDIIRGERGEILDRLGNKLATNEIVYELDINPSLIPQEKLQTLKNILKSSLQLSETDLTRIFSSTSYVLVSTSVTKETKDSIDKLGLSDGVVFVKTYKRVYPYGEITAPLIGIVGLDGNGLSGIELSLNDYLKGRNGRSFRSYNFNEPEVLGKPTFILNPKEGNSVQLTIDINIQSKVYDLVKKYVTEFNAVSGFAVVTDPETNEILAMVSYPSFDPTNFKEIKQNLPISFNYEPGSIMKPLVALAALDEGTLKPNDDFYCSGSVKVKDRVISCWKKHGEEHGLTDILVNSCDVAFAEVALKLGKENLMNFFKLYGFGDKTGIELPEEKGILPDIGNINEVELATMGFGQGVAVTQLQMITALNAITNGGKLYTPQIIKRIFNDNNTIYESKPILKNSIGTSKNINLIKDAMVEVVEKGAPKAKISGYKVMGKTGTAQKVDPATKSYSHSKLIYSFYGAIPYPTPKVAVLVSINETQYPQYSTTVSAPLFSEIGSYLVKYLRIEK